MIFVAFYHRSHRLASAALLVAVFKFTLLPFAPDTFALKEVCGSAGATAVRSLVVAPCLGTYINNWSVSFWRSLTAKLPLELLDHQR